MIQEKKYIDETRQGEAYATREKVGNTKKLFLESYGCQMNFSDSEIVASILSNIGYNTTTNVEEADLILLNTCSVREKAEQTVRMRLSQFKKQKEYNPSLTVGVLGCMAERLKTKLLEEEQLVDLVVGPDAYRDLPNLLKETSEGRDAINVMLSKEETYADISPVRLGGNGVTAFVTITRGCDNMCTFCIVPFTRGRERSRDVESILKEVKDLHDKGFKEVTLLGQNVNSYGLLPNGKRPENGVSFAELLHKVAQSVPDMRVRFTTSNPEDMTEDIIEAVATEPNLCNHIHFPAQSGSNSVLKVMNRKYTREDYLEKVAAIRRLIPDCGLTTDIFIGYHNESEEDFQQTLSLMQEVGFDSAFMFKYSERPGTYAAKHLPDNVPEEEKIRRLNELIRLQTEISAEQNKKDEGKEFDILIERFGKRSREQLMGRTPQNKAVVMPKGNHHIGETVRVRITGSTSATLFGEEV